MIYIGFDFSCNKTACAILKDGKLSFKFWPLELDKKSIEILGRANIDIDNRERLPKGTDSSEKFRYHVQMASILSDKIIDKVKDIVGDEKVIIGFEGSSFGSKGDAGLQLAGYRYILVRGLSELYGYENIYTYAPLTIKSIAGCAGKDKRGKDSMINAFSEKVLDNKLNELLRTDPSTLKKKTNYVPGIDDLVDSYFVIETLIEKLGF